MTHLSVNDHLEGILSDFEALKRSFDMEDVDDTPAFSPASPLNSPFSPSQSPGSRTGNGAVSAGPHQPLYQSRIRISSSSSPSQSPVLKSRITSSLSFNRGTLQTAKSNGSQALTRVSSFQTRLHPSAFPSSGHGSDSESLHSSTSSLECPPPAKAFQPIRPIRTSASQQAPAIAVSNATAPVLKKFSSHGNVFHSEIERPGVRLVPVTSKNHGSLPSLDLHIAEDSVPDLVPSPDAGYPPSEGWSSPTPDYKQPSSRNAKSVSREPSFSSSSSSSSPPADSAPINCHITHSPSPPPMFAPQKLPLSLQNATGRANGAIIPEHINRPLPRTQLKVNLNSTCSSPSHVSRDKAEAPPKGQAQLTAVGRTSSYSFTAPASPVATSRLPPAAHQDCLPESNVSRNIKPSETNPSSDRLQSMMQRANSFTKADNAQNHHVRDGVASEKPVGHVARPNKNDQEPPSYEKSSLSTRAQGNGHPPATARPQERQRNQRTPETHLESRNRVPSNKNCLQKEPQKIAPPAAAPGKEPDGLRRSSGEEKLKSQDPSLEGHRPEESGGHMEELSPATPSRREMEEPGREPFGYVGIDSVLEQMKRKAMKHGFEFNIMVVGQSGLGKSTLVNTLFKSKVIRKNPGAGIPQTLELKAVSQVMEERGVQMRLTVIDTPGFGDQINNHNCWEPIVKYVHEQYEKYLREEILVNRKRRIPDSRIHSCVYFIPPTGHWLRPLDLEFMRRLSRIVNVVPVIAKADTLTLEEREEFKQRIRKDLQAHGISVYPQTELDEDPTEALLNDKIREKIPFAVVGTDEEHQVNGRRILGRKTKWGIIEVENVSHCEFADLRDLLIRSNLQDLKDITHNIHYEAYRVSRLSEKMSGVQSQKELSGL